MGLRCVGFLDSELSARWYTQPYLLAKVVAVCSTGAHVLHPALVGAIPSYVIRGPVIMALRLVLWQGTTHSIMT